LRTESGRVHTYAPRNADLEEAALGGTNKKGKEQKSSKINLGKIIDFYRGRLRQSQGKRSLEE